MRRLPLKLERAEFCRTPYFHMVTEGIPLSEVLKGDYWIHVRKHFKPNDTIEILAEDGAYDAVVRVLSINLMSGAMTFRALRYVEGNLVPVVRVASDRFEVKSRGSGKYSIFELKTGAEVVKGITKDEAVAEKARLEAERQAA